MMLLRARYNNIQSFAYTWLHKGNQNEFLEHPKIKWLDVRKTLNKTIFAGVSVRKQFDGVSVNTAKKNNHKKNC